MDGIPLNYDDAHGRCKMGQVANTCRYLGIGREYTCLKGSERHSEIDSLVENNDRRAVGDNCSGPPNFAQL